MNKLQMAHEYAMKLSKNTSVTATHNDSDIVARAWKYADAMQAEADKRKEKSLSDATNGCVTTYGIPENSITFSIDKFFTQEEWQPDWSKAPSWAEWWAMDGFACSANWYRYEPRIDSESEDEDEWNIDIKSDMKTYIKAPAFGYTGDWRKSLRKRPQ